MKNLVVIWYGVRKAKQVVLVFVVAATLSVVGCEASLGWLLCTPSGEMRKEEETVGAMMRGGQSGSGDWRLDWRRVSEREETDGIPVAACLHF